jgi:hypothetical protein
MMLIKGIENILETEKKYGMTINKSPQSRAYDIVDTNSYRF